MTDQVAANLDHWKRKLLDLTRRNRLLNFKPSKVSTIAVMDELPAEVFRILATGDPSVAQVPHSHFVYVNAMRHQGTLEQQRYFFGEVLAGKRFGNAVLVASDAPLPVAELTRRAASDPHSGRVLHGRELTDFAGGAVPVTDLRAVASPPPPPDAFR